VTVGIRKKKKKKIIEVGTSWDRRINWGKRTNPLTTLGCKKKTATKGPPRKKRVDSIMLERLAFGRRSN